MSVVDLVFLFSFLFCAVLVIRLLWLPMRRDWPKWLATARWLVAFIVIYATALVATALIMPRRELPVGERKCFDDWCVAASGLELQPSPELCPGAAAVWVASVEVSSVARRIRQRAADATVEVEDLLGRRYASCSAGGPKHLRDMLGPGERFSVSMPFALPAGGRPVGLVVHHGAFPGVIIIGADQSWLHQPTLFRTIVR